MKSFIKQVSRDPVMLFAVWAMTAGGLIAMATKWAEQISPGGITTLLILWVALVSLLQGLALRWCYKREMKRYENKMETTNTGPACRDNK